MKDINKVTLLGRLTAEPMMGETQEGKVIASFTVATNYKQKREENEPKVYTEFHDIVCWDKVAQKVAQFLSKGALVYIEGRVKTNRWKDIDGKEKIKKEIVAQIINCVKDGQSLVEVDPLQVAM